MGEMILLDHNLVEAVFGTIPTLFTYIALAGLGRRRQSWNEATARGRVPRAGDDPPPLLSVPVRDAKETQQSWSGATAPGRAPRMGDDHPPPFSPSQGREGGVTGSQDTLKWGRWARRGP